MKKKLLKNLKHILIDDNFYDKNKRTKKELKSKMNEKYEKKEKN